jgi:hypothetical protein
MSQVRKGLVISAVILLPVAYEAGSNGAPAVAMGVTAISAALVFLASRKPAIKRPHAPAPAILQPSVAPRHDPRTSAGWGDPLHDLTGGGFEPPRPGIPSHEPW